MQTFLSPIANSATSARALTIQHISLTGGVPRELEFTNCGHFSFQLRTAVDLLVASTEGGLSTGYFTLKSGAVFNSPEKLYFTGSVWVKAASGVVLELITWG